MAEHWGTSFLASKSEFKFPASSMLLESRFQFTIALHLRMCCNQSGAVQRSLRCFFREFVGHDAHTYCSIPDRVALICGVPLPDSGHEEHNAELFLIELNDFLNGDGNALKKNRRRLWGLKFHLMNKFGIHSF